MEYQALFEPEPDGGFVITFPDWGWGVSQGDTEEEAISMATDLLTTVTQEHIDRGEPLPEPRKHRGKKFRVIRLSALKSMKAELYRQFFASGIRKADLARRMGIPKTNVDRLFDLAYHTRLDQIEAAFLALGKRINISLDSAA